MHTTNPEHDLVSKTALGSVGWIEWICSTTGLRAEKVSYTAGQKDLPRLEGTIFLNKKGQLRQPRFGPYLPFTFTSTNTPRAERLYRQWTTVLGEFAQDISRRGIRGSIALPPGILDARPFHWAGLHVQLRYTFAASLPIDMSLVDKTVRRQVRKATEAGYYAERSDDWQSIMKCLVDTEVDQNFTHNLDAGMLAHAQSIVGADVLRGYVVRNSGGDAVSGGVRLHQPGGTAIDWVQGTIRRNLSDGVNQLMYKFTLDDLTAAGASRFDFAGANIEVIARAKATWGMPLVPYLVIGGYDSRNAYRTARSTKQWLSRRRR